MHVHMHVHMHVRTSDLQALSHIPCKELQFHLQLRNVIFEYTLSLTLFLPLWAPGSS